MQTTTGIKRGEVDTCRDESEREVPFAKGFFFSDYLPSLVLLRPFLFSPTLVQPSRIEWTERTQFLGLVTLFL